MSKDRYVWLPLLLRSVDDLQKTIGEWGDKTFGTSRPEAILYHLTEEVEELLESEVLNKKNMGDLKKIDVESEAADVFILLIQYAHNKGFSLSKAVQDKMKVNYKRKWKEPDERGVIHHDEE